MKPFAVVPVGEAPAIPIRASQFIQLPVLTDTANLIHILLPAGYGQEPHLCRYFDRVEDRRFFLEGECLVTTFTKEGSFAIRGEVSPIEDGVMLSLQITNLSQDVFPQMPAIVSVQCSAAPSFTEPNLERFFYLSGGTVVYFKKPYEECGLGKARLFSTTGNQVGPQSQFHQNPAPDIGFIGLRSHDGQWVLGHGWDSSRAIFGNCHPAIMGMCANPIMNTIAPGHTAKSTGVLYIMKNTPEACVARFRNEFLRNASRG